MTTCPRCHQLVDTQDIRCPHCHLVLKAYGHPGIPLYQASGETSLCDRCLYHEDNTCTFPQRPYAKTCTLFQDKIQPLVTPFNSTRYPGYPGSFIGSIRVCWRRNWVFFLILGLIAISLLLALN